MIGAALRAHLQTAFGPQGPACALCLDGRRPSGGARRCGANTAPNETLRPAQSLEGNFLSAYVAGSARDTEAATVFFREAIQEDPRNQELLERAFVAFLANGSMPEAYPGGRAPLGAATVEQPGPVRPQRPRPEEPEICRCPRPALQEACAAARRT